MSATTPAERDRIDAVRTHRNEAEGARVFEMTSQPRRPSFRDHSAFWTTFLFLAAVGIMVAGLALVAFGTTTAALVVLAEIGVALAAGMR